jgi:hypothetical protein
LKGGEIRTKMKKWFTRGKKDKDCNCGCHHHGSGSGVYCLGFLGAAVYYISQATTFGMGVIGILKAAVWPAFIVFEALKYLAM